MNVLKITNTFICPQKNKTHHLLMYSKLPTLSFVHRGTRPITSECTQNYQHFHLSTEEQDPPLMNVLKITNTFIRPQRNKTHHFRMYPKSQTGRARLQQYSHGTKPDQHSALSKRGTPELVLVQSDIISVTSVDEPPHAFIVRMCADVEIDSNIFLSPPFNSFLS